MSRTFDQSLAFVKRWEGIDSDHESDRGGRTRYGISARAHPDVDIPNLTWEQAVDIYRVRYWGESGANQAPPKLAFCLFDAAVQHGPRRAIKLLQQAVNVRADGIYGPVTERAVRETESPHLELLSERGAFYARILSNDPSQQVFAGGWYRRLIHATEFTHEVQS